MSRMRNPFLLCILAALLAVEAVSAKTRWSALHVVPDADLYGMGEWTGGIDAFIAKDTADALTITPVIPLRFGFSEWVNVDVAYAGGLSLGVKARLLGETTKSMPTITLGIRNLFAGVEACYFDHENTPAVTNEIYLAFGKTIEPIKTRIHLGAMSNPGSENDLINGYFAIEKYFGLGLYTTLEGWLRDKSFHLALFANWRFFKDHLELSAGAVDLRSMLFDNDNNFAFTLTPPEGDAFVHPGFLVSLRYHGRFGAGKNRGLMGIEDRLNTVDANTDRLALRVDSLDKRQTASSRTITEVRDTVQILMDSVFHDPSRLENIITDKLITLKNIYRTDPFEPDKVKLLAREIAGYRERAVSPLVSIVKDEGQDRDLRTLAIGILGDMGARGASGVLLDLLAQTGDQTVKVELLIALGKMKETRAMYLLEQLANDRNDIVAITAQEVLRKMSTESKVDLPPGFRMRSVTVSDEQLRAKSAMPGHAEVVAPPAVTGHPTDTSGWDIEVSPTDPRSASETVQPDSARIGSKSVSAPADFTSGKPTAPAESAPPAAAIPAVPASEITPADSAVVKDAKKPKVKKPREDTKDW